MKESAFQKKIIKKAHLKGCYVIKIWGGGFQRAGIPDLIICYNGFFIAVELKTDIGRLSPLQIAHLDLIQHSGGYTLVLRPNNEQDLWDLIGRL